MAAKADSSLSNQRASLSRSLATDVSVDSRINNNMQVEAQMDYGPGSEIGSWENRSHVVPKTEFQDGSDRTRIFTHKITHVKKLMVS